VKNFKKSLPEILSLRKFHILKPRNLVSNIKFQPPKFTFFGSKLKLWYSNKFHVESTRKNRHANVWKDTFASEIHTHACRFFNTFSLRHAHFFRTHALMWFQHVPLYFMYAECDFHSLVCEFYTLECDFHTHECDFYTQIVILTSTSVSYTRTSVIRTRKRVIATRCVWF
jgi:hypothetical protein